MEALAGPYIVSCGLLVASGFRKLADPAPTTGAIAAVGLPLPRALTAGVAVAEVVAGLSAIVTGSAASAVAVAALYLAFATFVAVALRRGAPLQSCGCFGKPDTPPTLLHLVLDVAFAGVGASVAASPVGAIDEILAAQPMAGIPFVAWTAMALGCCYLILGALAQLTSLLEPRQRGTQ